MGGYKNRGKSLKASLRLPSIHTRKAQGNHNDEDASLNKSTLFSSYLTDRKMISLRLLVTVSKLFVGGNCIIHLG